MDNNLIVCWVRGIGIVLVPATAEIDGARIVLLAIGAIALGVWVASWFDKPKAGRK